MKIYNVVSHNDGSAGSLDVKVFPTRKEAEEYVEAEMQRMIDETPGARYEDLADNSQVDFDGTDGYLELFGVTYEWAVVENEIDACPIDVLYKFQAYVENDLDGTELNYVRDTLENVCGIDEDNAEQYGFGWVFTEE